MIPKLAHLIAPCARPDQLAVHKAHRMQRPFDIALPVFDEGEQTVVVGGKVVVLPDIAFSTCR